jgi:hypothetical protein
MGLASGRRSRSPSPRRDIGFSAAVSDICDAAHTIAERDRRPGYGRKGTTPFSYYYSNRDAPMPSNDPSPYNSLQRSSIVFDSLNDLMQASDPPDHRELNWHHPASAASV